MPKASGRGTVAFMPKPHGTYLRISAQDKVRHVARQAKATTAVGRRSRLAGFYEAVARASERDFDDWYRWMSSLVDDLKKGEPTAQSDKTRKKVSEVVGEVRSILEKAEDYRQLEGRLQLPVYPVLRAPPNFAASGLDLGLMIAVCQILECIVRIRRRGDRDA